MSDFSFHCGSIELILVVYGADITSFGQSHFFKVVGDAFPGTQMLPMRTQQLWHSEESTTEELGQWVPGEGLGGVVPHHQCPGL